MENRKGKSKDHGAATTARCFVDAKGGGLAALAAGIARAHGEAGALAATRSASVTVPREIRVVLEEIGAPLPEVALDASVDRASQRVDVGGWEVFLHDGEGELERLSAARIARDRIERRIEHGA